MTAPPLNLTLKKSYIDSLPTELLVNVVALVVSNSQSPICDLENLRTTCKSFYHASKDKAVGRHMALENERYVTWWDKERYLALLRACADVGNIEANYILGMEEVCNLRKPSAGLQHLEKAAMDGHSAGAYATGVFLFKDSATRQMGIERLDNLAAKHATLKKIEPHGSLIHHCRIKTLSTLGRTWINIDLRIQSKQCMNEACGKLVRMDGIEDQWADGDEVEREFCSSLCRWNYEYNVFLKML